MDTTQCQMMPNCDAGRVVVVIKINQINESDLIPTVIKYIRCL